MFKIEKYVAVLLGSALVISLLTGTLQAQKTTITYLYAAVTVENERVRQIPVKAFEKQHPDVQIKCIRVPPADYAPKLLTMVAGGITPDVFLAHPVLAPEFWNKKVIYSITELIAEDPELNWEDIMFKKDITGKVYNGEVIGFSNACAACSYFYNKDAFQKAGLPDPSSLYYQKKWDWDAFRASCPKLSKDLDGDGIIDEYAISYSGWPNWWSLFTNTGADMYNEEGTKCTLDTPETIQALQFLVDEAKNQWCPPPQVDPQETGMTFQTGKIAMHPNWVYNIFSEHFQNLPFDWGVVMPPFGPRGPKYAAAGGGSTICIARTAENKDLAYKFIKCVISTETFLATLIREPEALTMPTKYSQLKLPEYREAVRQGGYDLKMVLDIWEQGSENGDPNNSVAGAFGYGVWLREIANAARGIKTAEQACKDAAREIQVRIDEKLEEWSTDD
jgi:multiple sugar transport system substrate-binding protein